jgi:hypothetical protein
MLYWQAIWPSWRIRKAGAWIDDVEPLDAQARAGVLSVAQTKVDGIVCENVAATWAPVTKAASSKSLLVSDPVGLAAVAKARWMAMGNGACHKIGLHSGWFIVGAQKPPMPVLEASVAPKKVGALGTN